jgi:hypothetical protein
VLLISTYLDVRFTIPTQTRQICELKITKLPQQDLACLCRVSRDLNLLATSYLYRTVRFHCEGRIGGDEPLIKKLDTFGHPQFTPLIHTRKVLVTGSWYDIYQEIEANLGPGRLLSPAVQMFCNIMTSCIVRMPNLQDFM